MRTQLVDMDLGTWNYTPNALGEVVSQKDAKNQTTTFVYDGLSRPLTRTIVAGSTYMFDYAYNTLGQLDTLTYPTSTASVRFKAKYGYSGGYLSSVQEYTGNVNGPILWNLNLLDARMNAVSETYGNGLWLQNGFDPLTGDPLTRQSGTGGQSSNVQNLSYLWDTAGNLSTRQDLLQSLTETFSYDALDRLTLASGPAAQSTAIGYDAIGNLTSKTGVGSYTYHATKKHAVVNAGGTTYGYDANGNLTSRGGATVTWRSHNRPNKIGDPNGYSATFSYAPDRSRWKQVSTYAGGTDTTFYVGGLLEKLTTPTRTHWKHLIPTPSGQVQVIRRSDGSKDTFYVTTDHLGSTDAVLNASGTVLMRGSFGVHGARRASNWQGAPSSTEWQAIADTTRRGYTGHEQIDNVMVVHMNGRVFDPVIGRFLSADPYIDGPQTTQGWNRYAYVHGNLLSATDPTGYDAAGRAARISAVSEEIARDSATLAWLQQCGNSYADYGHMAPMSSFTGRQWFEFNHMGGFSSPVGGYWLYPPTTGGVGKDADGNDVATVANGQAYYVRTQSPMPLTASPSQSIAMPSLRERSASPQTLAPDACKSATNAPRGLAATNQAFRNNVDPNRRYTVDASQLTVRQTSDFNSDGRARGVVQGSDWSIFGSVTLQQNPAGSISLRPDQYNFEQHNANSAGESVRNIETYFGFYAATYGGTD